MKNLTNMRRAGTRGPRLMPSIALCLSNVSDCEALIARGMGWGAFEAIRAAGVKPFITDLELAEDAVKAYLSW